MCNSQGVYDTPMPTCEPRSCGIHPAIVNGQVTPGFEIFFGSSVGIECDLGYVLDGVSSRYLASLSIFFQKAI